MRCVLLLFVLMVQPNGAQEATNRRISAEEFRTLHQLIKPQRNEFAWYDDIPWLTRIQAAREKAAAEGKPMLIWCSADGQPCGAG